MISVKMRNWIAGVVTFVWAVNIFAKLFYHDYNPDPNINAIFMAIVGGLFASSLKEKHDSDNRRGDEEPAEGDIPKDTKHRKNPRSGGGAHRD